MDNLKGSSISFNDLSVFDMHFRKILSSSTSFVFYHCTLDELFFSNMNLKVLSLGHGCKDVSQTRVIEKEGLVISKNLSVGVTFPIRSENHLKLLCRRMRNLLGKFEDYLEFEHSEIIPVSCGHNTGGDPGYAVIIKANPLWYQNTFLYHTLLNTLRASLGFQAHNNMFKYEYAKSRYYRLVGGSSNVQNLNSQTPQAYRWSLEFIKVFKKYKELFNLETKKLDEMRNKYTGMSSISIMEYKRQRSGGYKFNDYFFSKGAEIFSGEFKKIAIDIHEQSMKIENSAINKGRSLNDDEFKVVIKSFEDLCERIMNIVHPPLAVS